jgi:FAD/FMN-containing dehydrogenase
VYEIGGWVLDEDAEGALASEVAGSPWSGPGTIGAFAVLPSRAGEFLSSMSATCDALALRSLIGTGEVRFAPEALELVASAARDSGGRLVIRRGAAISAGDTGDGVALELMRSVKRQLDPARTLSPGRQVGGI